MDLIHPCLDVLWRVCWTVVTIHKPESFCPCVCAKQGAKFCFLKWSHSNFGSKSVTWANRAPSSPAGASPCPQGTLRAWVRELEPGSTMAWREQDRALCLTPGSSLLSSLYHLLPGHNISRSCTEEGWSDLEPGPYPIACGLDERVSGLDEVRASCASVHPGVHIPQVHISQSPSPGSLNRVHTGLLEDDTQGALSSEPPMENKPLYICNPAHERLRKKR